MKRLLTFVVMLVSFTCLWAQGAADVITLQSFRDAGYDKSWATPGNVTGESGAEYSATDIGFDTDGRLYLYNSGELFTVTKSAGMIASVEMQGTSGTFEVYVSHEPVTKDNYAAATLAGTVYNGNGVITVEGDYEYIALRLADALNKFTSIAFTWKGEEEDPEPPVTGGGTDEIVQQMFRDAGYTSSWANPGNVTAASGAEYSATDIDFDKNGQPNVMALHSQGELITVTKSAGKIGSVEMQGTSGTYEVYVSHEPVTKDNYAAATLSGTIYDGSGTVTVEGDYEYAAIRMASYSGTFTSVTFTWKGEEEDPEPPVTVSGTDDITLQTFRDAGYDGSYATPGNVTGETGAEYSATDIALKTDGRLALYSMGDMVTVTKSVGRIAAVAVEGTWGTFDVYVSHEPVTKDNYSEATLVGSITETGEVTIDGDYEYAAIRLATAACTFTKVSFTWGAGSSVSIAATPEITCEDAPVKAGSTVSVSTLTENATLHLSVYVNDQLDADNTKDVEASSYTFPLPGADGDVVKVEAYATAEGMEQSETAVATYELYKAQVTEGTTDVITQQSFRDAGYTNNYANPGNVTAGSGAEYTATDIDFKENGVLSLHSTGEIISVTKSAGMIAAVAVEGTWGDFEVYVSHEPITTSNYSNAKLMGTIAGTGKVTADGDYEYAAVRLASSGNSFTSVSFIWKGEEAKPLVDHITASNLQEQNPEGNFSASAYDDRTNRNDALDYKGESGADYHLTYLISNGSFWNNDWDWDNSLKGECYNTTAPGYIKSVKFEFDSWIPSSFTFRVSTNPITKDNMYDAKQITLYRDGGAIPEWTADELCRYIYLETVQERITDLCINWTTEAPVVSAKTPVINCYDYPVTAGSNVSVSTETENATLHLSVYVNDELDEESSKDVEGSSCSFGLPGNTGDVVRVEAYASAENMVDSEMATATFTLAKPLAEAPVLEGGNVSYVIPGQQLTLVSATPDAQITYQMSVSDWENEENNWQGEEVTAPSPVTITVPEQAKPGTTFVLTATAIAEGYDKSYSFDLWTSAISSKLDAPAFSIEDGAEVRPGTELKVTLPAYAKGMHYVINDGEEKTSEDYTLTLSINEDMTITAWAYGDEPFEESEKATYTYRLEKLELWQNAIVPENFTESTDDLNNSLVNYYEYTDAATKVNYVYNGGLYPSNGAYCFYMAQDGSILYNTTPAPINRIKVDGGNSYSSVYILLSDEAPITEISAEMADYDYNGPRLRVGEYGETAAHYGEWIDLQALGTVNDHDVTKAKYFAIYRFGQNTYVNRVVIDYSPAQTGAGSVSAEADREEKVYNMNGMLMPAGKKLAPGVYVRKANGKSTKFIVK